MHKYRLCQPKNFLLQRQNLPTLEALTVEFVCFFLGFFYSQKKNKPPRFPTTDRVLHEKLIKRRGGGEQETARQGFNKAAADRSTAVPAGQHGLTQPLTL